MTLEHSKMKGIRKKSVNGIMALFRVSSVENVPILVILSGIDYNNELISHLNFIGLHHNQWGMAYMTLENSQMNGIRKKYK